MNPVVFLFVHDDFLDLVLFKLVGQLFDETDLFIHFGSNKNYRNQNKFYSIYALSD